MMRDGKAKSAAERPEFEALKADIDKGLADIAAGRVKDFNARFIIQRGKTLFVEGSPSG